MKIATVLFRCSLPSAVLALLSCLLFLSSTALATIPWTPQQIAEEYQRSHAVPEPPFQIPAHHGRASTLDDIAYFQHFRQLCDFLVSLQYTGAGLNYGGMIEAEAEQNIIETDNTQEAIREWSQWAIWTGDTATYGPHIRMAMQYLVHFPAWREDLQGGFYYGAHNCGWGFEAAAKYRQAYADTAWNWYADSCALWTVAHNLAVDTVGTGLGQLDPLAEGLAIGGLYPHAVYRQRADWHAFAVNKGRTLKRWFERNPARLNNNESWALCGGTALWGVCESFFAEYPDSGQIWVDQYGSHLRVWTSNGTWNHSANAWYCNAQYKCFELSGDSTYWNNATFITDSLIGWDTDHDGGIPPGRTYPVTDDASWVSSYMGWMGMERIINLMPRHDVAAGGFVSPDPRHPYADGDTLLVAVRALNHGIHPELASIRVYRAGVPDSVAVLLLPGADSVITIGRRRFFADPGGWNAPFQLTVTSQQDTSNLNDTMTVVFDVRPCVPVEGTIRSASTQQPVPARVEIYHSGYPDSVWSAAQTDSNGHYVTGNRGAMAGLNRIRVTPLVQFMDAEVEQQLMPDSALPVVNFDLSSAEVALIDDSPADTLERFYQMTLDTLNLGSSTRTWNEADSVVGDLSGLSMVIWFTGNATQSTLTPAEQTRIQDYLNGGGRLILSGQNISDDTSNATFLHDVLHCTARTSNTNLRRVFGAETDSLFTGADLYLIGSGGAQNQTSPASINVLPGARELAYYAAGNQETCGIGGSYGNGRYIFLSYGLEAASGINNSTTRHNFLTRCFTWFDNQSAIEPGTAAPVSLSLNQNYPNPFNPTTTISFLAPRGANPVRLVIYNLLGQEVRTLYEGVGTGTAQRILWDGLSSSGIPVSSGMYVYRLGAGDAALVKSLQLLR